MSKKLSWVAQQQTLHLHGELTRNTLLPIWQQRKQLMADNTLIDVVKLQQIDSAGLALLLYLYEQQKQNGRELMIVGVTQHLHTLITLYNLQSILPVRLIHSHN